ncbi:hypothetical protein BXO88_09080 [Oribacterium sp. C9]|uniref:radical SAM/SPASM domain-containing protein n=1 Tax=Oribacterium sp. C9 TaxID=1943579 RepID=UPI0009902DFE|nr:radical SAM protein [Oribacterium sp. C9]OON86188.1 hypothetical protein BXO88_09080 [Oribacterium sp. C9]
MEKKIMREHMKERFSTAQVMSMNPPVAESLNIELNNSCNHRCIYCMYHGEHAKHTVQHKVMDYAFAKKIIDNARDYGFGSKELGLYISGEPLLYPQLPELIEYAKKSGFKYIFLTSNGSLADKETMRKLIECGLDSIRFSVNAADRRTYQLIHGVDHFEKVSENIKDLSELRKELKSDIAVSLSCVMTKQTITQREKMIKDFGDYVDDIVFIPISFSGLEEGKWRSEFELKEGSDIEYDDNYICPIVFNTVYISAEGLVMPCCNIMKSEYSIWDLNRDLNLMKAWQSEGFKKYRALFMEQKSLKNTICEECMLREKNRIEFLE